MGCIIHDQKSVSAITPAIILPLFVYAGVFKNSGNLSDWVSWVQYISPIKYAFIGFIEN